MGHLGSTTAAQQHRVVASYRKVPNPGYTYPVDDTPRTLTPLEVLAAQCHEMYVEFVKAGFTEDEAIALVVGLVTTNRAE